MPIKATDIDQSQKGAEEIRSGIPFWTPPAGEKEWKETLVRVFPPREDHVDNKYYHWLPTHGNLPGAGRPVLCPKKMNDDPCPACDMGNVLWNEGNKEAARKFFSSWRAFVNMVVLNRDGTLPEDATVKVWGIPKQFFEDHFLPKTSSLPRESRDFTAVKGGRNILIGRKGKSAKDTKYDLVFKEPSDWPEAMEELVEELTFLPNIYATPTSKEIRGLLAPPADTDDDDERPRRRLPEGDPWGDVPKDKPQTEAIEGEWHHADDDDDDHTTEDEETPPRAQSEGTGEARRRLADKLRTEKS